jgi:hypothetical protein
MLAGHEHGTTPKLVAIARGDGTVVADARSGGGDTRFSVLWTGGLIPKADDGKSIDARVRATVFHRSPMRMAITHDDQATSHASPPVSSFGLVA